MPYVVFLVALAVAVVAVALTPETRDRPDPLPAYRIQRVSVPAEARGAFWNAAWGAFIAFGALGLFTGLTATFLVGTLHETSHLLAGVTVFALFAAGVVAQVSLAHRAAAPPAGRGQRADGRRAGRHAGRRVAVVAELRAVPPRRRADRRPARARSSRARSARSSRSPSPDQRAEALAGVFLAGYVGLSLPVVGAGVALQLTDARNTLLGFAVIEIVAIILRRAADARRGADRRRRAPGGRHGLTLEYAVRFMYSQRGCSK